MRKADRIRLGLPILQASKKCAGVSNSGTSRGKYVKLLPFPQLSKKAAEAGTFEEFLTLLMSVGKTDDDGNVSIYTKKDVKVYKEEDILITCRDKPIIVGRRYERGRYRILLLQTRGQCQARQPTNKSKKYLQEANSVHYLPTTEEAIKWMHSVCGYPVTPMWLKAIKVGNFTGWTMLNEHNITK